MINNIVVSITWMVVNLPNEQDERLIRERLKAREESLPKFQSMRQQDKARLHKEIQADHQKVLFWEAKSPEEEKERWREQRILIEQQAQRIMREDKLAYLKLTTPLAPKPTVVKNTIAAFVVGGLICVIGQVIMNLSLSLGMGVKEAGAVTAASLIFGGALLTGLGIYDELGRFAGAGSIVPISGFANSIASSALEYKSEGFVYGVGARLFTIAGPVLTYGLVVSVLTGLIYYFAQ